MKNIIYVILLLIAVSDSKPEEKAHKTEIDYGQKTIIQQERFSERFICPVAPCENRCITSSFGERISPTSGRIQDHFAVDISGENNSEIMAADSGIVWDIGVNRIDGKYIVMLHKGGYKTKYCHLSRIFVRRGNRVERGHIIGIIGETGITTGVHLHFELWQFGAPLNPEEVLGIKKNEEGYF